MKVCISTPKEKINREIPSEEAQGIAEKIFAFANDMEIDPKLFKNVSITVSNGRMRIAFRPGEYCKAAKILGDCGKRSCSVRCPYNAGSKILCEIRRMMAPTGK